jgi:hypothetical protein
MDKRSIVVLVIAAIIILGGYILGEAAKGQMSFRYSYRPPYANAEEARIGHMWAVSRYSLPIGLVVGTGGALWLVVSTIQGNKKE